MSLLADLRNARRSAATVHLTFLGDYKPDALAVHVFLEGRDDPSYTMTAIHQHKPANCTIHKYVCGNKRNVLAMQRLLDVSAYTPAKLIYFVDRDLDDFINPDYKYPWNVYATDHYSIEHHVVTLHTLRRVLDELFSQPIPDAISELICQQFTVQKKRFADHTLHIMACCLAAKKNKRICPSNNVTLPKLFRLDDELNLKLRPSRPKPLRHWLIHVWSLKQDDCSAIAKSASLHELLKQGGERWVSGKYLMWFFISFLNKLDPLINQLDDTESTRIRMRTPIGRNNAMDLLGPRSEFPESLVRFIKERLSWLAK